MMSRTIPSVLQADNGNSISTERALKQIKKLLLEERTTMDASDDRIMASLEDIDLMIRAIDRS